MKVQDSGMPDEKYWNSFFDIDEIFSKLSINNSVKNLAEIGCGYGSFTLPAANIVKERVFAFDIEPEMIEIIKSRTQLAGINNIIFDCRDVLDNTTGLPDESIDYLMLFNILHNDKPEMFLNEAQRILKNGGKCGILHWRSDIKTPRGPAVETRPTPLKIQNIIKKMNMEIIINTQNIGKYHFGIVLGKLKS